MPIQNQMKPSEVSFASSRSNVRSGVRSRVRYGLFTRTDQIGNGASRVTSEEARRFRPSRLPRLEYKLGHPLPANRAIKHAATRLIGSPSV